MHGQEDSESAFIFMFLVGVPFSTCVHVIGSNFFPSTSSLKDGAPLLFSLADVEMRSEQLYVYTVSQLLFDEYTLSFLFSVFARYPFFFFFLLRVIYLVV
jgi:hypothetical protein